MGKRRKRTHKPGIESLLDDQKNGFMPAVAARGNRLPSGRPIEAGIVLVACEWIQRTTLQHARILREAM